MKRRAIRQVSIILFLTLVLQTFAQTIDQKNAKAADRKVTLVGDLQNELGGSGEWNPSDPKTTMALSEDGLYKLSGTLPAGTYEYKIVINGSWDENYGERGERNGANYKLILKKKTSVTFVYNDSTHIATVSIPLSDHELPRIAGDIQPAIGAGSNWSPAESTAILKDDDKDNLYTYTTEVPKGSYEFKIVLGSSWDNPSYPSNNMKLNVLEKKKITFFYNHDTHDVYTDYDAGKPDGVIQKNKLYHNTWDNLYRSPFGAVKAGGSVKLRLQAQKGDLTGASVVLKNYTTGNTTTSSMKNIGWTELKGEKAEFWEATVKLKEKGVYGYKFIARDGTQLEEYGEDAKEGKSGLPADSNAPFFQLTVYDPSYQTPDWMKSAVVYQIFPDRFFNGDKKNDTAKQTARGNDPVEHRKWGSLPDNPRLKDAEGYDGDGIWSNDFFGGDIEGIREKLDYIQSLGVNTLYLNPIAEASSNHKYDATDYKTIDPMFASPKEFQAFVNELKKRKMQLILDGVFNHVGDDSIYFDRYGKYKTVGAYEYWSRIYDLVNKGVSEKEAKQRVEQQLKKEGQVFSPYGFQNWFNIENKKENGIYKYQGWWGYDSLPEIKSIPGKKVDHDSELNNEAFANYIMYDKNSVAKSWLKRGASGWRLDVANEVDPDFWREFRKELKKDKKKDPLILGEIWDDASQYFLGDLYDSVMNYRFRGAVIDYLKNGNAEGAVEQLNAIYEDYPPEAFHALMNLVGSHDTPRASFVLGNGTDSVERAEQDKNFDYELGIKRLKLAAIIQMGYPGAPAIYYGDEAGVTGSKDPDNRRTYPWGKENKELIRHYQTIGSVRNEYRGLFSSGELHHLYADGDVFAYARRDQKNVAIIVTNRGTEAKTIELDVKDLIVNQVQLIDQLDQKYNVTVKEGKLNITIPAMEGRMLVTAPGQSLERPKAVSRIMVKEGSHSITLAWDQKTRVRYNIYETTISGGLYKKIATTKRPYIKIDSLDNGRRYYFAVTAVDHYGNESAKTESKEAIPHSKLMKGSYAIKNVTKLADGTIDLSKSQTVDGEIFIENVTNEGKAQGLLTKLEVKEPGKSGWSIYDAEYVGQKQNANVFQSEFLPVQSGKYEYRYAISTDLGRSWARSPSQYVAYTKGIDREPPAKSMTLKQPQVESGQVNLSWTVEEANHPYMAEIIRNGHVVERLFDPAKTTYKDDTVTNGITYSYEIRLYEQYGNFVTSNKVSITPDLRLVKVTFQVNAPDYTPQSAKLTIPGSKNGWNTGAWEMTRNGAVTNDFEYTVEAQEGEVLTYKYVKDGSWDHEGLADHTPSNPADDDVSYYGYGAPGTDLQIVVKNEGNHQMAIHDKILRWIDEPAVITSHSDGQTVSSDSITLKGTAIKGGVLTINGERVAINNDMTFSHSLSLKDGENNIQIHIEPSEESKTAIFKNDAGAIAKSTKTLNWTIIKK